MDTIRIFGGRVSGEGGDQGNADLPFWQALQKVTTRALRLEAGDAEPAGLAVVLAARIGGYGVSKNVAASAGGLKLGGVREVADDGDLGDVAGGRGAECANGARGADSGAAGKEGRHFFLL